MEIVWSDVIGELVTAILKIMVPILVTLLLKWGAELYRKIKEGNPQLAGLIKNAAQLGYAAAEEFFRNQKDIDGNDKLDHAISEAEKYLRQFNVKVDLNVIKDAIIAYGVENNLFNWTADRKLDRYLYDENVVREFNMHYAQQHDVIQHAEETEIMEDAQKMAEEQTEPEEEIKDATAE